MFIRILIFIIALVVLFVLLRSVYRDVSERIREHLPRRGHGPKGVEEPNSKVEWRGKKMILRVSLPDVASSADVKVKKLSRSIEIRAYAGEKVYFKLFPIPPNSRLISKRMEAEEYVIELITE